MINIGYNRLLIQKDEEHFIQFILSNPLPVTDRTSICLMSKRRIPLNIYGMLILAMAIISIWRLRSAVKCPAAQKMATRYISLLYSMARLPVILKPLTSTNGSWSNRIRSPSVFPCINKPAMLSEFDEMEELFVVHRIVKIFTTHLYFFPEGL